MSVIDHDAPISSLLSESKADRNCAHSLELMLTAIFLVYKIG